MFRRPLISALVAGSSRRAVRAPPAPRLWQRAFASEAAPETDKEAEKPAQATGPRKKVIFDETSNPELDKVLTEMLHKIILPAHLPANKRKIISQAKNAQKIEVDPVVIEVEGYEHRFPVLDYRRENIPSSRRLLNEALHLMKTREDWANLTRITSGYIGANRLLRPDQVLTIIRWAGKTGNMYAIIDALRRVRESHLRVRTMPVADNILYYLQAQALESGYAERETADAWSWARQLHELMEDPQHAKRPSRGRRHMHREPQVVGQVLHLAAAHAVHHRGGTDDDGAVAKLAETLAIVWPEGHNLYTMHGVAEPTNVQGRFRLKLEGDAHLVVARSRRISAAAFILHGIRLAEKVVGPELAERLQPAARALKDELDGLAKEGGSKDEQGWLVFDKLFGKA